MENESNSPDLTKESSPLPDEQASLGAWLQSQRMKKNLEPADVERLTKYSSRQIKALEDNAWDELPSGFSLRALVRRYTQVLGLDEEEAISKLERQHSEATLHKVKSNNMISSLDHNMAPVQAPIEGGSKGVRWLWIILAVVLVVIIALFVLVSRGIINPADFHIDFLNNWFNTNNE